MRTREEQIEEMVQVNSAYLCHEDYTPDNLRMMLAAAISEAEKRVRAEIGRDSERLDWLTGAVQEVSRVSNRPTRWILEFHTSLDSLDRGTLRQAIDAVMEMK